MTTFHYQCRITPRRPVEAEQGMKAYADPPALADTPFKKRPAAKRLDKAVRPGDHVFISAADGATPKDLFDAIRRWDFDGVEIEFTDADAQPGWETFRGAAEKLASAIRDMEESAEREDAECAAMCN